MSDVRSCGWDLAALAWKVSHGQQLNGVSCKKFVSWGPIQDRRYST